MKRWQLAVLTGLALLAGCGAGIRGPQPRDVWHEYLYQGRRFGYEHTTVTQRPDGNFSYVVDMRLLISVLGAKQELTRRTEYVVTGEYRPVSVKVEGKQLSGTVGAAGSVRDGKLVVTFERAGHELQRALDVSGGAIFSACLGDWLRDLPAHVETATVETIEDELWSIVSNRLTRVGRDRSGSRWDFDMGAFDRGSVRLDARGAIEEMDRLGLVMHVKRCTPEQARDIDYLKGEGRFALMFPVGRELPAAHRLTELTVKLTWQDIPFEKFRLSDSRQKLLHTRREGKSQEALVQIHALPADAPATTYPVGGEEFAPYLRETMFIKPQHEQIRAVAAAAVAGKKTALAATEALAAWVSGNLKPAMIAETLTGPEALKCRRGKCSEYAILFASLARSVGIPARVVLGVRMGAGNWVGHLWNEAYVGRWVPVDAAANEVGESFALLKLIHSDSVLGTQEIRWTVTESLNISVEDFKARPAALADKYTTGVEGRVYTNVDYACRLTAPGEGWSIEQKPSAGAAVVRFKLPQADQVWVHFVAFPLPAGMAAKQLIDARVGVFQLKYKDFELLKSAACTVAGAEGHSLRFRRAGGKQGTTKMGTTEVAWTKGSFGYLLNLIAEESAHDKHLDDFQKLLASFELLKKD